MANDILQGVPSAGSWAMLCSEGGTTNSECELNEHKWNINSLIPLAFIVREKQHCCLCRYGRWHPCDGTEQFWSWATSARLLYQ